MKKITLEKLSQVAVIIIALSALFVSVWQVRNSHQHNKLSVKPYLDYHIDQMDSTLHVAFSNEGLGPAIIKTMTFEYAGNTYDSLYELLKVSGEYQNINMVYNYSENTIIRSGDKKLLVNLKNNQTREIKVRIEYTSIYKEKGFISFTF